MGEQIVHSHSPDDLLAGLYLYSGRNEFTSNKSKIHTSIEKIFAEHRKEIGDLSEEFIFFNREIFPFSKTVESALMRLQLASVIEADNPSYFKYRVNNNLKDQILAEIEKHFSSDEIEVLKRMSEEFARECAIGS